MGGRGFWTSENVLLEEKLEKNMVGGGGSRRDKLEENFHYLRNKKPNKF